MPVFVEAKAAGGQTFGCFLPGLFCAGVEAAAAFPARLFTFEGGVYLFCVGAKAAALTRRAFICFVSGHTLFYVCVTALPRPAGIVRHSARIDSSFCRRQAAAAYPSPCWRSNCRGASRRKYLGRGCRCTQRLSVSVRGSAVYTERNGNMSVRQNASAYFLSFLIFCVHLNN